MQNAGASKLSFSFPKHTLCSQHIQALWEYEYGVPRVSSSGRIWIESVPQFGQFLWCEGIVIQNRNMCRQFWVYFFLY